MSLRPSNAAFRFGDGTHKSLGIIPVRIPTPISGYLHIDVDVVRPDVPLLIGLDVLDQEQLIPNNVENQLESRLYGWSIPIIRKLGHLYITWEEHKTLFTRQELLRMHRHFYHPSARKLLSLIRRSNLEHIDKSTRTMLEEISQSCSTCQTFSRKPQRFKVSMPNEKVIFNREVALDLMWLDGKAILHVVDIDTSFNSAHFLKGQTVEHVWDAFLNCWTTLYVGHPIKMRVDQGSAFTSVRWTRLCDKVGIEVKESGIEHHNALGAGERYHDPLRRVFKKVKHEYPSLNRELALRISVKAINDTMGPEGLVPSLLVFGCLPRFSATDSNILEQKKRMQALQEAYWINGHVCRRYNLCRF